MPSEDMHYAGRWFVPGSDKPLNGVLHHFAERGTLLLELNSIYQRDVAKPNNLNFHQLSDGVVPYITGELFSGARITLLECNLVHRNVHNVHRVTELVSAAYAFWGIDARKMDVSRFRGAFVYFGDIVRWSGLCCLEWDQKPTEDTFSWRHSEGYSLDIEAGFHLDIAPSLGSFSLQPYGRELTIKQLVTTKFRYKDGRSWRHVTEDVEWFRRFVELGKRGQVDIEGISHLHPSVTYPKDYGLEGDESMMPGEVVLSTGGSTRSDGNDFPYHYLFDLSEAVECGALISWFSQRDVLGPIVGLYSLAYSDKIPSAAALFLNFMQALETLHSRFFAAGKQEYMERVDALCSTSRDLGLRDFLCDSGQKGARSVYLKSRISDLLYADGQRPVRPVGGGFVDFPKRLTDTRNYYTHYDRNELRTVYSEDELPLVNLELKLLLEYHLMLRLGFDEGFARERVNRRLA